MITQVPLDNLRAPEWHANYLLRPDMRVVEKSIDTYGFLQNLVAQEDGTLIDGVYRAKIAERLGIAQVPVVLMKVDELQARILHVHLNRNRGLMVGKRLSDLIRDLLRSGEYETAYLANMLGITSDEMEVLADGTLIKHRNIPDHRFSRAWVPFESPTGEDIHIERPTGQEEQVSD